MEDAYLAETEYEEFLKSGEQPISIEEMEKKLGLAD
jgi:RHH-type rel operon transcriptional repressor/antitoxin RelB